MKAVVHTILISIALVFIYVAVWAVTWIIYMQPLRDIESRTYESKRLTIEMPSAEEEQINNKLAEFKRQGWLIKEVEPFHAKQVVASTQEAPVLEAVRYHLEREKRPSLLEFPEHMSVWPAVCFVMLIYPLVVAYTSRFQRSKV